MVSSLDSASPTDSLFAHTGATPADKVLWNDNKGKASHRFSNVPEIRVHVCDQDHHFRCVHYAPATSLGSTGTRVAETLTSSHIK